MWQAGDRQTCGRQVTDRHLQQLADMRQAAGRLAAQIWQFCRLLHLRP
jgi:hypothetical protein